MKPSKYKMTRSVTEEVVIDPNVKTRGRKSSKLTRKVKSEVTEEKDLTILKQRTGSYGTQMSCTGSVWMVVTRVLKSSATLSARTRTQR